MNRFIHAWPRAVCVNGLAREPDLAVTKTDIRRANAGPKSGNKSDTDPPEIDSELANCVSHAESPPATTRIGKNPCFAVSNPCETNKNGTPEGVPEWTILDSNR